MLSSYLDSFAGKEHHVRDMLSLKEVAGRLDVSVRSVRRLIDRGDLVAGKVGHLRRVHTDDLEEYVRRVRQSAAA